jgi:hypothetical protein
MAGSRLRGMAKRLRDLESHAGFDASGHAPRSEGWWNYWDEEIERIVNDESDAKIPLDVIRAIMHRAEEESAAGQPAPVSLDPFGDPLPRSAGDPT